MELKGKNALVTGGGTGIGAAIAIALAGEGCHVAVAGRRPEPLDETVRSFAGQPSMHAHTVDVADRASVAELFTWFRDTLGPVDILINSAGINVARRSLAELDPDDWDRMLQVNATGAFLCMREALNDMRSRHDGLIVNISSVSGKRAGLLGGVGYNASKFAMAALGITASLEEGKHGVRVTNVYPGEVNTPILDKRPQPVGEEHKARILQPEDIAAAVLMVAKLPPRAHVPELVIKPTCQDYV